MPAPASGRVLPVAAVGDRGLTAVILRRLSRPRSATAATAMTFPSAKPRLAAASVRRYPAVPSAARGRERQQTWRKEKDKGKRLPSGSVSGSGSKRRSAWRVATGNGSDAHETGPAGVCRSRDAGRIQNGRNRPRYRYRYRPRPRRKTMTAKNAVAGQRNGDAPHGRPAHGTWGKMPVPHPRGGSADAEEVSLGGGNWKQPAP